MNHDDLLDRVTEACKGTPGDKRLTGMCVTKNFYAQCNQDGSVAFEIDPCDEGITCDCDPFVRVKDRNPCSNSNGNSCDLDI